MSAAVKNVDNQTGHRTKAEKQARAAAEDSLVSRAISAKPPRGFGKDAAETTYWKRIMQRMDGVELLDELDTEMLAIYCKMLARRDRLQRMIDNDAPNDKTLTQLASLERNIAAYADRLGFTPQARARLAQKRAANAAETPEGDFFGE